MRFSQKITNNLNRVQNYRSISSSTFGSTACELAYGKNHLTCHSFRASHLHILKVHEGSGESVVNFSSGHVTAVGQFYSNREQLNSKSNVCNTPPLRLAMSE